MARNASHVNSEVTRRTIAEDTSNAATNTVTEEVDKLPTLALTGVTPLVQRAIDALEYNVVDNYLTVGEDTPDAPAFKIQFKALTPNKNGITPKAESYNGRLPDSSAVKLALVLAHGEAINGTLEDELAISRLIPTSPKAESEKVQLKKELESTKATLAAIAAKLDMEGINVTDLKALLSAAMTAK